MMFTFIIFPHFDLISQFFFEHVHSILLRSPFLLFEFGAYHKFMFVLGFILSRHTRAVVTGSPARRMCKFDSQEETKSYFVK